MFYNSINLFIGCLAETIKSELKWKINKYNLANVFHFRASDRYEVLGLDLNNIFNPLCFFLLVLRRKNVCGFEVITKIK